MDINKIVDKYPKYSQNKELLEKQIKEMAPIILLSLEEALEKNDGIELSLYGYTVERLMNDFNMNVVAAHLTLDSIIKKPRETLETLERGHDTVSV
jgi:hypothetical protein